ncbi:response regulator transcription factor [Brachybacterium sp. EF45031]|uniref:MtrAB system response regulator MtrA n=1 Tax=Brachybacterium sillae TaxID=2810536 RepID=UPI00217D3038|nr:MtrAB system response regulator MtrA [Brachybacterium sillae]MCS6711012.1 response regulator transcription factor [Brachybacterium sillae]
MATTRILVVDDDQAIAEMVSIVLRGKGFDVVTSPDGASALEALGGIDPDVVLLDLMLPGMDGIEVCRRLREVSDVPVIMLTARSDSADVVEGLEAGADDYLTKPFDPDVLVARIRARVRRSETPTTERLAIGDLTIDVDGHEVRRGSERISLTPLEFDLLTELARRPWQVFTREALLREVWGYRHSTDTRLVNVHVQRLRAKIEKDPENPRYVLTVRGVGYRAGSEE